MKKALLKTLCLLTACLLTPSLGLGESADPAREMLSRITLGWNLGNTLDANTTTLITTQTETSWGNPVTTQELIDLVASCGFDAIRIPVTWFNHMNLTTHEIDPDWMDRVQQVVDMVLSRGLICILNMHHDTGTDGWLKTVEGSWERNSALFAELWQQIALRFRDYGPDLMLEGFNEILNGENAWANPDAYSLEATNQLNQIFVDTVRATGGGNATRVLVVNTYAASADYSVIKGFQLPTDTVENSLIAGVHMYVPFDFTDPASPTVTEWKWVTVKKSFQTLEKNLINKGIPLFIGEFGAGDKNNSSQRQAWAQYYVKTAAELGLPCFWWDNGGDYALVDRRKLTVLEPELIQVMLEAAER